MAKQRVYGFDEKGFRRVREAVRRVLGSPRTGAQQRRQIPIVGEPCTARNEVWQITVFGSPTGGTFDVDVKVGGTTTTLTFNWDDTAAEVATELETHANIASGDVTVTGGPFPDAAITITFTGDLANSKFDTPEFNHSMTGGSGVNVLIVKYGGHPKNGSAA